MTNTVEPSVGWGVLHLFLRVDRDRAAADPAAAKRVLGAIDGLEADGHQALTFAVLGHKADLGVMVLGPDLARLHRFQRELLDAPLVLADSFVSLTETSEYMSTEEQERARLEGGGGLAEDELEERLEEFRTRMAKYREDKLHPRLPRRKVICFYPMSKRRGPDANWYALGFDDRRRIMGGHARIGRAYAGRVLQLITGAVGIDDWEWGVTLLADDPAVIKSIVYEMRFDEATASFGEFGPFVTGLLLEPADALGRVGLDR